jgi:hypothetical protein
VPLSRRWWPFLRQLRAESGSRITAAPEDDLRRPAAELPERQMPPPKTRRASAEAGQGSVEYAAIIATLAVMAIVSLLFLGSKIDDLFRRESNPSTFRPPPAAVGACDPSYSGWCIPSPPPDLDCDDLAAMGVQGEVKVEGSDPQGLDSDGDGIACN